MCVLLICRRCTLRFPTSHPSHPRPRIQDPALLRNKISDCGDQDVFCPMSVPRSICPMHAGHVSAPSVVRVASRESRPRLDRDVVTSAGAAGQHAGINRLNTPRCSFHLPTLMLTRWGLPSDIPIARRRRGKTRTGTSNVLRDAFGLVEARISPSAFSILGAWSNLSTRHGRTAQLYAMPDVAFHLYT